MKKRWASLHWMGKKHFVLLALIAAATFSGVYAYTSSAACFPGTLLGRACYQGYFTDIRDTFGTNVLPVVHSGQALPTSDVYNVDTFYNFIRAAYFSGNAQRNTGAAFIYNTLKGNNGPGVGKNISEAQWQALYASLKGLEDAGKISWFGNVSDSINSYYQGTSSGPNPQDDAYYGEFKNEAGILIRDYNNNVVYKLLRYCANPIGAAPGIPDPLPKNYILTPYVTEVSPSTVESGSKMSVKSRVENSGEVNSQPTQWELTQLTVQPGKKAPHEDEDVTVSPEAPCQSGGGAPAGNYFNSPDSSCKSVIKDVSVFNLGSTSINYPPPGLEGIGIGDIPVGTRVCYVLSVQPRANNDSKWAHSKPKCSIVGKKPKVQIWGGDVLVRGSIETSTSVKTVDGTTKTFGSWVEYGVFSVGLNKHFASGSGLIDQTNNNQSAWSKLTFANDKADADVFGQYAPAGSGFHPLSTVSSFFKTVQNKVAIGPSVDISGLGFATGGAILVNTAPGNLTITGGSIPAGRSVVIVSDGMVTIDGNISYTTSPLTKLQDIPQVIIIAKAINIKDSVTHIDAWLVAEGAINTCHNFTGFLTSGKCASKLEVNGPVVAGKLILNRTAGSDTGAASGDPGERFNVRPDAHLWTRVQSIGTSKAQTVYSVELPPRF